MSIFKACDIRGVYPTELGEGLARRIGRSIGTLLIRRHETPQPRVLLGGDVRRSTPALKVALLDGLRSTGCHVLDLGTVPTPVFFFAFRTLGSTALPAAEVDGAVMITGSHNPPEFNGLKVSLSTMPITPEEIQAIAATAGLTPGPGEDFVQGKGAVEALDVTDAYREWITSELAGPHDLKVVVDAGNGCYSDLAPGIFRTLGFEVVPLFCQVDGFFSDRHPDPSVPEHLTALCAEVRRARADYGVAFDGDGDRAVFVDERGRAISTDRAIVLMAENVFAEQADPAAEPRPKVVYDLNCSRIVPEAIERLGGIPLIEQAGHAFIRRRMIEEDALFGGEVSGHLFYRALGGSDDGLYSALRMGRWLAERGESLAELVDRLPSYCITPRVRLGCESGAGQEILDRIAAAAETQHRVLRLDGVRVDYDDGWALARVSITEPLISLRFEAAEAARLRAIIDDFLRPVPEVRRKTLDSLADFFNMPQSE